VLLLIDDDKRALIEGIGDRIRTRKPLYRTPLMLGAGEISGWLVEGEADLEFFAAGLERLAEKALTKYGKASAGADPFLYAVGDGNHSLATAKAVWDEYKAAHAADPGLMDHPARWALVEAENIYDEGIEFEPIHRAVFGAGMDDVVKALAAMPGFTASEIGGTDELRRLVADGAAPKTRFGVVAAGKTLLIETSARGLSTDVLQPLLDAFVSARPGCSIDYLHGEDETIRVGRDQDAVGILLPPVGKSDLFSTVARSGPLPRKSFSMGSDRKAVLS
jgi:hypothetical protein